MSHFIDNITQESELKDVLEYNNNNLKSAVADSSNEDNDCQKKIKELENLIETRKSDLIYSESEKQCDITQIISKKRKENHYYDNDDNNLIEEYLGVTVKRKCYENVQKIIHPLDDKSEEAETEEDKIAYKPFNNETSNDTCDKKQKSIASPVIKSDQYSETESKDCDTDTDNFIVDEKNHVQQEASSIFGSECDFNEYIDNIEEEGRIDEIDNIKEDVSSKPKKGNTRKSIFEAYEPYELKQRHYTEFDHEICFTDIPERMQLRSVPLRSATDNELSTEAEWIYNEAFNKKTISIQDAHLKPEAKKIMIGPQTIAKIKTVLDFMINEHFEVPFIAFYRKEYILPELNINDLWKIYKYDAKWCQLCQRKESLLKLFRGMMHYQQDFINKDPDALLPDNLRLISDEDINHLENVQSTEQLNDSYHHFMLYYSQDVPKMQEVMKKLEKKKRKHKRIQKFGTAIAEAKKNGEIISPVEEEESNDENESEKNIKQAVRTGPYFICCKAGLAPLAKKFGLKPEQFAKNVSEECQIYKVEQDPLEPRVAATDYVGENFRTVEEVLKATQLMVAIQLAREPLLRESIRKIYRANAKISVRPTTKGVKDIDEDHYLYYMKFLKDKPIRDLKGDEFLKLYNAEKDSLIEIYFSDVVDYYTASNNHVEKIKQLYRRDEFDKNVQEWNAVRLDSVEMAITKMIIPDLKKEMRLVLLNEAKDCVIRHCGKKMYNWLKIAPYKCEFSHKENDNWDTTKGIRVMGLAYTPDFSVSAFACIVEHDGEYLGDYLKLPNILKKKNSLNEKEKSVKKADLLAIKNFIYIKKPHVVVIGGQSKEALMIVDDVKEIILELVQDNQFPKISVEILENELSLLYSNSEQGIKEFPVCPDLLRQAISLARRLQDPLSEFSHLCYADDEILCLRYHTLQTNVAKEDLLEIIQQEFLNRVNEVGVNINKAIEKPYLRNILQFVCGLGPRKAQFLIQIIEQTNQLLHNREQLLAVYYMGPKVFLNCAGFIKIDISSFYDTETCIVPLDSSRIHPESYDLARKMAIDALDYEIYEDPDSAIKEIFATPELLKDLDLDAFANELQRQELGNKCITLYDIRAELSYRYRDLRFPYQPPNPDQIFAMLTKETPETFYIGKRLEATVISIIYKKLKDNQIYQATPVKDDTINLWRCPFCLAKFFGSSDVWNHLNTGGCPGTAIGVGVRFDNGVSGFIHKNDLSDRHVINIKDRVKIGSRIHCRVIKIDVKKFGCECTSKSSDLADHNYEWRPEKDPFYDYEMKLKSDALLREEKKIKERQFC